MHNTNARKPTLLIQLYALAAQSDVRFDYAIGQPEARGHSYSAQHHGDQLDRIENPYTFPPMKDSLCPEQVAHLHLTPHEAEKRRKQVAGSVRRHFRELMISRASCA